MKNTATKKIMLQVMGDSQYKGKHVIVVKGKIFTAKTSRGANKILDTLEKKYPRATPAMTFIPKTDILILWL